jgi:ABC-type nitrate/sulfonate/bicarbonate transport system substrate-binding protein
LIGKKHRLTAANGISLEGIVKQTPLRLLMFGFLFLPLVARSEVPAQEKIRIGLSTHSPGFLPTVIAEKKGFYAKYGLASEHILIAISVGMNALGTGDLDYSNGLSQSVLASIRGVPVKLVMLTQENLVFFLLAKPQIQKVTDLRGKTIGISYFGSSTHMVAEGILRYYGMVAGKDVNIIPSGDDQGRLAALDLGRDRRDRGNPPSRYCCGEKRLQDLGAGGRLFEAAAKRHHCDGQKDRDISGPG